VKAKLAILFLSFISTIVLAQDHDFLPHYGGYHQIEKANSTGALENDTHFFTQVKPYSRKKSVERLWGLDSTNSLYKQVFLDGMEYSNLTGRSTERRRFNWAYPNEADFLRIDKPEFDLHVNPVWQLGLGHDPEVQNRLFVNSRGLDIRGTIDGKVAFYTRLLENQVEYPYYVKHVADSASVGLIPYEGFWKEYNGTTTDFLRAYGYVDFGLTKHISAQVGYGRHFIGNGIRSMVLSDFSNSYPYLRIDTEVWRIKYTNLFAELMADVFTYDQGTLGASRYPKKFMAGHFLEIAMTKNFHLGLFESIIFGQPDSIGAHRFKPEYLNPIIFYRTVEQQDGSSANAVLGTTFSWDIKKKANLYGQFLLDELIISELTAGNGWWGNKYAYQIGGQYYDLLLKGLDLRLEHNFSRPYNYAHQDFYTSYTHYRQPLAHPLGANFTEWLGQLTYQPSEKWSFYLHGLYANYGANENGINYGQNPQITYNSRPEEYGNEVLQGNKADLKMVQWRGSYQWKHNFFVDLTAIYRNESFEHSIEDRSSTILNVGFRWNMPYRNYLF
jgi:hypothetical protein